MAEPFMAQISMFAGNFAPRAWAFTDGQLLPIASNSALFSLMGATYGGDARTTFAVPDLRARSPLHAGNGGATGLRSHQLGARGGAESFHITTANIPPHSHALVAERGPATTGDPEGAMLATHANFAYRPYNRGNAEKTMASQSIAPSGSGLPIQSQSPYCAVNFILALQGIFPSRS